MDAFFRPQLPQVIAHDYSCTLKRPLALWKLLSMNSRKNHTSVRNWVISRKIFLPAVWMHYFWFTKVLVGGKPLSFINMGNHCGQSKRFKQHVSFEITALSCNITADDAYNSNTEYVVTFSFLNKLAYDCVPKGEWRLQIHVDMHRCF